MNLAISSIETAQIILILFVLFLSAAIFIQKNPYRIHINSDSSLLSFTLFLFTLIPCLLLAFEAYLFFKLFNYFGFNLTVFILGVLLILPTILVLISYFKTFPNFYDQNIKSIESTGNSEEEKFIIQLVDDLNNQFSLNCSIKVIFSRTSNTSPHIVGRGFQNCYLILPFNIFELSLRACSNNKRKAKNLIRLVICHELSHIKHGDLRLLPLLTVYPALLFSIFGTYIFYLIFPTNDFATNAVEYICLSTLNLSLFTFIFIFFLLKFIATDIEKNADAEAILFLSKEELDEICNTNSSKSSSHLEEFVFLCKTTAILPRLSFSLYKQNYLMSLLTHLRITPKKSPIKKFRDSIKLRTTDIKSKSLFVRSLSDFNLFFKFFGVGVLGKLSTSNISIIVQLNYLNHVCETDRKGAKVFFPNFLEQIDTWSSTQESAFLFQLFRGTAPVIFALLMVFLTHFSIRKFYLYKIDTVFRFPYFPLRSFFTFLITYSLTGTFINDLIEPKFIKFPALFGDTYIFWLVYLPCTLLFPIFVKIRVRYIQKIFNSELPYLLSKIGLISVMFSAQLLFNCQLNIVSGFLCILVSILFWDVLFSLIPHKIYIHEYLNYEKTYYLSLFSKQWIYSFIDTSNKFNFKHLGQFVLTPPNIIFSILTYEGFHSFLSHIDIQLSDPAEELIKEPLINNNILSPSTFISVALFLIFITRISIYYGKSFSLKKSIQSNFQTISSLAHLIELKIIKSNSTKLNRVFNDFKNEIISFKSYFTTNNSFSPEMASMCRFLEISNLLNFKSDQTSKIKEWLLKCANSNGGFAPFQNADSRLINSYRALRLFSNDPLLPDKDLHKEWLIDQLKMVCSIKRISNIEEWLRQTSLIVKSLNLLSFDFKTIKAEENIIYQICLKNWRTIQRSIKAEKYFYEIFSISMKTIDQSLIDKSLTNLDQYFYHSVLINDPLVEIELYLDSLKLFYLLSPKSHSNYASFQKLKEHLITLYNE